MRITVKAKLAAAFSTVIILSGITAWLGITNLGSLNATMDSLLAGPVERLGAAKGLQVDLLLAVRAEKNLILEADNAEQRARYDAELQKQRDLFGNHIDDISAIASAEGKKRLEALRATRQRWVEVSDSIRGFVRNIQASDANKLSSGAGRQLVNEQ